MPTSRKRKKKPQEEVQVKRSSNIVKSPLGKAVIIILSLGFIFSVLIGFIYTLYSVMTA